MNTNDSRRGFNGSLIFALGFPLSLILLGILEATHTPEPLTAADNARILKVGGCVALAALSSVLSVVSAALPLSRGNLWPLTWLVLLALGWLAFMGLYDWGSLLDGR